MLGCRSSTVGLPFVPVIGETAEKGLRAGSATVADTTDRSYMGEVIATEF